MASIHKFTEEQIESLAKVVGEFGSGTDITRILEEKEIEDVSGEATKWKRLYGVFLHLQKSDNCANRILNFISSFLAPVRFVNRKQKFEEHRGNLNSVLCFAGIELGPDRKFSKCQPAQTIGEAEKRLRTIQAKFQGRRVHPEVLKYCKTELLEENYFHAVFEASKGLGQRIRELSGIQGDGAVLVDRVFAIERPVLAFNSLITESEKSEHKGFALLIKGCFGAIRNRLAHEPKIMWQGEDDAADCLSLISLMHRKLDDCVRTGL